jgi:N4-gp56 family major capsid protein
MSDTTAASALTPKVWDRRFFAEYIRTNRFKPYMGTGSNSIFQIKEDLTKEKGDRIVIPLVTKLTGAGVTGSTVLEGNEESLSSYGHEIIVNPLRHAVVVDDWQNQKSAIDLRQAARDQLMNWAQQNLRGGSGANAGVGIIEAFGSIQAAAGGAIVKYADASEANKDAWLAANDDRVLFGAAKSNNASNDHSAALAQIDNTSDKLTPGIVSLAKRMAQEADPHIRPFRVPEIDQEWFVMFCNSRAFRDLANNSTMTQANRDALARGKDNPIFKGGDLMWDGVIIREVPEIAVISGVGGSSIDVAPNYLCGAQAIGIGWAQRTKTVTQTTDYEFRKGVAVSEIRGIDKMFFNGVQHGCVTVYTAGVADS